VNDIASNCPTNAVLHRLIESTLGEDESETIRSHIQNCRECEQRLDRITDDPDLVELRNGQSSAKISVEESAFQERLSKLKQLSVQTKGGTNSSVIANGNSQKVPKQIGKYEVEGILGSGAFGQVFAAWDATLKRSVAIKRLRDVHDVRFTERFMREAKALGGIRSDHVVDIYEVFRDADGVPHLVMERIDGGTLRQWSDQQSDLPKRKAIRKAVCYVRDVAQGLADVHAAGIVHRDIKPSNVLIDSKNDAAKLTDFGVAHEGTEATLTADNELLGTPAFMSPEQASGNQADHRSDIYSLGASLYQIITGQQLFRGASHAIVHQVISLDPVLPSTLNPHVPKELETVCLKALEKQPSKRYQSSRLLCDDLQNWLDGKPVTAKPVSNVERAFRWCFRNKYLAASLAAVVLSLVVGSIVATTLWLRSERSVDALSKNRRELRSTLSGFQQKLFADQSLHWQMSPSFRADMFREFIGYLDDFAAVEWKEEPERVAVSLTEDYLSIAESALLLDDLEEALAAAQRGLQQIELLSSRPDVSFEVLHLGSRLCGVCTQAHHRRDDMEMAHEYADRSMEYAQRGIAIDANVAEAQLAQLKARFYLALSSSETTIKEIEDLFEEMIEFPNQHKRPHAQAKFGTTTTSDYPVRNLTYPTTVKVGWFLANKSDASAATSILERNDRVISRLRESMRTVSMPLFLPNHYKGINQTRLANAFERVENREKATGAAEEAVRRYELALQDCPFNPTWRLQLAELEVQLADWLLETQGFEKAEERLERAVDHLVQIMRNEPDNQMHRILTVQCVAKKAGLSEKMQKPLQAATEYYHAAQDFRHIIAIDDSPHQRTVYDARLWLMSRVMKNLSVVPQESSAHNIVKFETTFAKQLAIHHPHLDSAALQAVVDRELEPKKHKMFCDSLSFSTARESNGLRHNARPNSNRPPIATQTTDRR